MTEEMHAPRDAASNGVQYRALFDDDKGECDLIYDVYGVAICNGLYGVRVDYVNDSAAMRVSHDTDIISWPIDDAHDTRGARLPQVEYDVSWDDWTMH